jgi:hypothetical protein
MTTARAPSPSVVRLAAGFALAPLVVPIAWIGLVAALGELPDFSDPASVRCSGFALDVAICLGVGYALTLLFGLPLVLALRWAGLLSAPWILAGGALSGAGAAIALLLAMGSAFRNLAVVAPSAGVGVAVALVVAGIFCAVAGVPLRRPRLPTATSASSPATSSA